MVRRINDDSRKEGSEEGHDLSLEEANEKDKEVDTVRAAFYSILPNREFLSSSLNLNTAETGGIELPTIYSGQAFSRFLHQSVQSSVPNCDR